MSADVESSADRNSFMITDEEAELYDRQIRLWGAETQQLIRKIKVLVIGARGVGAELCKNLILTGIKSLTLMDNEHVREEDLESQFFLSPECMGQNRAKACLKGLQNLNPHVEVIADESVIAHKPILFYSQFDAVVVTNQTIEDIILVNNICRYQKKKFFCADAIGSFGFSFCDLKQTDNDQRSTSQVSFQSVLNLTPSSVDLRSSKRKPHDPSYVMFRVLLQFFSQYKRKPTSLNEDDEMKLMKISEELHRDLNVSAKYLEPDSIRFEFEEFGPTCVIVGGFLAQEVLKSFHMDRPNSLKFFNPMNLCASSHNFLGTICVEKTVPNLQATNDAVVDLN